MSKQSRYQRVSRRAMLKASLGAAAAAAVPGLACGTNDDEVFAGAVAEPQPTTTAAPTTTTTTDPSTTASSGTAEAGDTATTTPATPTELAVAGEMVISFTYTQGADGLNERPYIAVWIEDAAGDLATTVSLWYEQGRRGERWLDHLTRWYDVDLARIAAGGTDTAATISSATRDAGSYAVAWDGLIDGVPAGAGDYFVCIESAREEGPYSLIREPIALRGSLENTVLPDSGELSAASVRIDV